MAEVEMNKCNDVKTTSGWETIFNRKFYWLIGALGTLALIKIFVLIYFPLDLHSEEAQYWVWSKHLQLSYYSKPPMIAYLNWFSTTIFGNTEFGIRINAVLIGLLVSVVTYLLTYKLFNNINKAVFASLITCIFPFLISISTYFSTDTPLILFWLSAMLFYWMATDTGKIVWWILFGMSVGFGALSKYSMFLIFIPLILFSWKYHREIFKNWNFYISILIGLLIFSPVIYWNVRQNGVGFLHIVDLAGTHNHPNSAGKIISNVLEFVLGQVGILLPFYQYPKIYQKYRQKSLTKQEEFLILPAISMFLIFLGVAIFRESGAYINWTMFAYTGIPILFAHFSISEKSINFNLRLSGLMLAALLLFVFLTSSENKILPLGKLNPANKMIGWTQLANKIDEMKSSLPTDSCYVFSSNYHITSEMWFYQKGQPTTYFQNINSRMTQFDLWPEIEQFINTNKTGIFIEEVKIPKEIKDEFGSVIKEDSCLIYNQNRLIDTYYIYLLKDLKRVTKQHSSY